MRVSLLCSVASVFLASAAFAQGEGEFPATLKGHAVLPAQTFIDAPTDAPDCFGSGCPCAMNCQSISSQYAVRAGAERQWHMPCS